MGDFFSLNGRLLPAAEAKLNIDNLEFSYGFGVYENLRWRNNKIYFLDEHVNRLFHSATIIGLVHNFSTTQIKQWIENLGAANKIESANVKMYLIGGAEPSLYVMFLAPVFPNKKIYHDGVKVTTYNYERFLPQAKTLNMLPSYLAYSLAKKLGAFDALLIDQEGCAREGTRCNFFAIKHKTLYTTPVEKVLDGVTRRTVIECAQQNGYKVVEKNLKIKKLKKYDGTFLTSTSGKIIPIREVEGEIKLKFADICIELKKLIDCYNKYLDNV